MRNGILVDLSEDFFRYWTYTIPEKETGVFGMLLHSWIYSMTI